MSFKSVYDMLPKRKVVEPNKMTGLRIGHMLAQQPMTEQQWYGDVNANRAEHVVDNGYVLYQDIDGYIKKPVNTNADVIASGHVYLLFTEEKQGGYSNYLVHYTNMFTEDEHDTEGRIVYPRMIALYSGDLFTTDNYLETVPLASATHAILNSSGQIELQNALPVSPYVGPLFRVIPTTLPNGTTDAAQFEVISTAFKPTI